MIGSGPAYVNLGEFYAENWQRHVSREVDFGLYWKDSYGHRFRITWVEATGEVYAVALGAISTAMLDSETMITFGGNDDTGFVEVLASGLSEEEVERRLDGWAEACGNPIHGYTMTDSMRWVRERLGA